MNRVPVCAPRHCCARREAPWYVAGAFCFLLFAATASAQDGLPDDGLAPDNEVDIEADEQPLPIPDDEDADDQDELPDLGAAAPEGAPENPDGAPAEADVDGAPADTNGEPLADGPEGQDAEDVDILPGISGTAFLGTEWDVGSSLPSRFSWFLSTAITYDDNVFVTGIPGQEVDDIVVSVLLGATYATDVNDGQQKYRVGAQIEPLMYTSEADLTDVQGFGFAKSVFEFYRSDITLNATARRSVEPFDFIQDRAPNLTWSAGPTWDLRTPWFNMQAQLNYSQRIEDETALESLDHTKIEAKGFISRPITETVTLAAEGALSDLEYDLDPSQTPFRTVDGFERQRYSLRGTWVSPGDRDLRVSLALGLTQVDLPTSFVPPSLEDSEIYASADVAWTSPSELTRVQFSATRDIAPSATANFEIMTTLSVAVRRTFNDRWNGSISGYYQDVDRGATNSPSRIATTLGAQWRLSANRQIFGRITRSSKSADIPNDEFDRLQAAVGLNISF